MRLFIAVNFTDETRRHLLKIRNELRSNSERGSFSLIENLHLTLTFLGECDAAQAESVKSILDNISFTPFDISVDRIGRFRQDRGDIWWAGLGGCKALERIRSELVNRLSVEGFKLDCRKYNPHITLGRQIVTGVRPWPIKPFGETIDKIQLMKSDRIDGKLTYTVMHTKASADCSR